VLKVNADVPGASGPPKNLADACPWLFPITGLLADQGNADRDMVAAAG
jgi:hypothetical protein